MLGLILWSSEIRFPIVFLYTLIWIPLFKIKESILNIAGIFSLPSPPPPPSSMRRFRYEKTEESESEMCAICLMEFVREDGVCKLRDCGHVFHTDCIDKWIERNNFSCPLCRCFFNVEICRENVGFLVPDHPSSLYYFLQ